MKLFGTILIASTSLLNSWAAEDVKLVAATNPVVITTAYIDSLVAEARTNNPSLKAADWHFHWHPTSNSLRQYSQRSRTILTFVDADGSSHFAPHPIPLPSEGRGWPKAV